MTTVEPIRNIEDIRKIEKILLNQSKRNLLIFTIGINCGLRISDILALNVGDVKGKTHIELIEKKTGKYKKYLINSKLKLMFAEFTKNKNAKDPLFVSIFNNRMERVAAYYIIRTACEKANIKAKIGTHSMRKTFGYHHYKKFKDLAILQKIFNHSTPQTTLRYIGIEQEQIDESYASFVL